MTTGGSVIVSEIAYNYGSPTTKVSRNDNFTNNSTPSRGVCFNRHPHWRLPT